MKDSQRKAMFAQMNQAIDSSFIASTINGFEHAEKQGLRNKDPEVEEHIQHAVQELKKAKQRMHDNNEKEHGYNRELASIDPMEFEKRLPSIAEIEKMDIDEAVKLNQRLYSLFTDTDIVYTEKMAKSFQAVIARKAEIKNQREKGNRSK